MQLNIKDKNNYKKKLDRFIKFCFDNAGKRKAVETYYTALYEPEKIDGIRELPADEASKAVFAWLLPYRKTLSLGSEAITPYSFIETRQWKRLKYIKMAIEEAKCGRSVAQKRVSYVGKKNSYYL